MQRAQLQHIILEIGERFGVREFYVVGSAAILAAVPFPPPGALVQTRDVDVLPRDGDPKFANQISWVLGESSDFEVEHAYYAQGVTNDTVQGAPRNWRERALPIEVRGYRALCMGPADLFLTKLAAGREKDLEFCGALALLMPLDRALLAKLTGEMDLIVPVREALMARLRSLLG